ncbi:MAG TPA: thrombospondin type 3 repeat-containing protein [Myxococcota bacterium]|nr:thrombospondin type 3 repeat-containing protein [Myxococcota bacterium]
MYNLLLPFVLLFCSPATSFAQVPGECTGGLCGAPEDRYGGCGCGCGSVLILNVEEEWWEYLNADPCTPDTDWYTHDRDGDGIEDEFDNCPTVQNRDQTDSDGDCIGNACDNCEEAANEFQFDYDQDGVGDACDPDADGDGVENVDDNCTYVPNELQENLDADRFGDFCDSDVDGDGFLNIEDNCPLVYNPDQLDSDPDTYGDACNADHDNDGVQDFADNCPLVPNPDQANTDGDLFGDLCDADMDDDGVKNTADNCPLVMNHDQHDGDADGVGDFCDDDFCCVVDPTQNCLDTTKTFTVQAGPDRTVVTGEPVTLFAWTNRTNRAIDYQWTMEKKPGGSGAGIEHPEGSVSLSTPFVMLYTKGHRVQLTPDRPGDYTVRLTASLVFGDELFPGHDTATAQATLTAEGASTDSGCTTGAGTTGTQAIYLMVAIVLVFRRRRS